MGHKLVFNGIDTSDYGIIISGAGTYATPERDITSLSVPGRNGDIHFDNGRYNNIQVTYECGISKGFESKYLPFMRQMLSAPVYSRLEDDYHLDEFRLGTFRAEMVPDVGTIMRSGKFELVFDCKPQRFLKAGEREIELNFTDDATGGTDFDLYAALDNTIKTEVNALGIPADSRFPYFTLTRDTDYVFQDKPRGADAWIYPNDAGFGYWRYADNPSEIGDKFYGVVTNDSSPFLSIHDDQGEVYTPSYFGTTITNPTKCPASPLIKVYGQISHSLRTAFGVDAENWVKVLHLGSNSDMNDGVLIVDCGNFDFYSHNRMTGEALNLNNVALFNGELTIPPGTHVFRVSNFAPYFTGIEKITLTPNWWTL